MTNPAAPNSDWARRLGLNEEMARRLEEATVEDDRSAAYIIRKALVEYLQARAVAT